MAFSFHDESFLNTEEYYKMYNPLNSDFFMQELEEPYSTEEDTHLVDETAELANMWKSEAHMIDLILQDITEMENRCIISSIFDLTYTSPVNLAWSNANCIIELTDESSDCISDNLNIIEFVSFNEDNDTIYDGDVDE